MTKPQQKALSIGTLFLLFFTFFTISVYANPNYWTWGNIGQNYASTSYSNTVFSSNTPITTTNFSALSSAYGLEYSMLAYDLNGDLYNEFILPKDDTLYVLDNTFTLKKQFSFTTPTICGAGSILDANQDSNLDAGFVTSNASGNYFFYIYYDGTDYQQSGYYKFNGTSSDCVLHAGSGFPERNVYTVTSLGKVSNINLDNNISHVYGGLPANYQMFNNGAGYSFYGGGSTTSGAISNNYNIYYLAYQTVGTGGALYIAKFNPFTNITINTTSFGTHEHTFVNYILEFGSLGNPEINTVIYLTGIYSSGDNKFGVLDANDLTSIISYSDLGTGSMIAKASYPVSADVNLDGNNEVCIPINSTFTHRLKCYDLTRTNVVNYTFPDYITNSQTYKQGSFAYMFNDTKMQYITEDYIYKINSSNGLEPFINITDYFINSNTIPMVVNINTVASANEQKSIIFSGGIYQHVLLAEGTPGVCGNLVCEYGETVYNCPEDCLPQTPDTNNSASYGTVQNMQACKNDSWCLSGSCIQDQCVGRSPGASCTLSAQCMSGVCDNNNICTRSGISKNIVNFFDIALGGGLFNHLLYGLIFIGICGAIGALLGSALNVLAMFGLGIGGAVIGLLIAVLVFEWIPIWFLFLFIVGIAGLIFMSITYSGRS